MAVTKGEISDAATKYLMALLDAGDTTSWVEQKVEAARILLSAATGVPIPAKGDSGK